MADAARAARLADRIKVIVAQALERRVKDPRLGFVTVTDARVTNDLQHATVYYTVYGSEQEQASTKAALESAKGILRSEVGKNITARLTPTPTWRICSGRPVNATLSWPPPPRARSMRGRPTPIRNPPTITSSAKTPPVRTPNKWLKRKGTDPAGW